MRTAITAIWVAAVVVAGYAVATGAEPSPRPSPSRGEGAQPAAVERPAVEVVFVLDTTGSMGGLIQAAKEKIWAIANTLIATKPTPRIKMGLVGYRDRGDQYVTKLTNLSDDIDAVYKELMGFQANGGGDGPESVNQALNEAVTKMQWSTDAKTYRVIFLVGDCPPHMDYADDVKYPVTCQTAAKAGITINTIQCGTEGGTPAIWTEIANRAEGRYFRVEQSGNAILASTPFDAKLGDLAKELATTRVYYGSADERAKSEAKEKVSKEIEHGAAPTAAASRAEFLGSDAAEATLAGKNELVNETAKGRVKVNDVKTEELPENMRKMTAAEREKYVAELQAKRDRIQSEIKDLSAKRQAHIDEDIKKRADKGAESLDAKVYESIKEQAAKKGIEYKDGAVH